MALPHSFENSLDYFEECLIFFRKYEHLFNFLNTDLLINNALEKIQICGLENVDVLIDGFDLTLMQNDYLTDFFGNLNKLKVEYEKFEKRDFFDLELLVDVPLSRKKKHEIAYLAEEIEILCKDTNCETVVDFGSGLGYLDQHIFKTTGFKVLGLECSETNYVGAKQRQNKYHSDSTDHVKYIKHKITEESYLNISNYLEDKFRSSYCFCIAGLHACADLTIDAINIFLKMDNAQSLIIMPCCYHRLAEDNNKFKNFPLSNTLKQMYEKYNGVNFLKIPFLRLATQAPNAGGEKLHDLVFSLLARAVLQLYCYKHNCKIKRKKRKPIHMKRTGNNFEIYWQSAITGFNIVSNNENEENLQMKFDIDELRQIWSEISEETFKKAAIFILLQNHLQPIFENFLLYDRLVYLQENGIKHCKFKKIVNERISPRCLALLAQK